MTDKITRQIFFQFTFNHEISIVGFQKFRNGYEGMCMSGGKFLKEWQVTDKIIE